MYMCNCIHIYVYTCYISTLKTTSAFLTFRITGTKRAQGPITMGGTASPPKSPRRFSPRQLCLPPAIYICFSTVYHLMVAKTILIANCQRKLYSVTRSRKRYNSAQNVKLRYARK